MIYKCSDCGCRFWFKNSLINGRCFDCDHKEYIRNNYPPRILKPNYTSNVTCSAQTQPINTTSTYDYTLGTSKVESNDNSFANSLLLSSVNDTIYNSIYNTTTENPHSSHSDSHIHSTSSFSCDHHSSNSDYNSSNNDYSSSSYDTDSSSCDCGCGSD